ncbi:hypothetical protein [Pontiella sp.]|uniref:hypothetical protein n=1 Tax=Pontiella sp. TaxID=2837462 RepID=UPI003569F13C
MKKILNIILLLAGATMAEESLTQRYAAAFQLETEKNNPVEAVKVYRELVEAETTGEERFAVAQAAKRLMAIYRREDLLTMEEKVEALKQTPGPADHVVETFGEPLAYTHGNTVYTKNNLPSWFTMDYPDGFSVNISDLEILRLSFTKPTHAFHGIHIGSNKKAVYAVFPPDRIEKDTNQKREDGVAYTSNKRLEFTSYQTKHGVWFYFAKDWVFRMDISDLAKLRAYTPPNGLPAKNVPLAVATKRQPQNTDLQKTESIEQIFERGRFLETAKGQTEEALGIYRRIAAAEPTSKNRTQILQALEKVEEHHLNALREESTFTEKMDRFTIPPDDRHIIDIFGAPESNEPASIRGRILTYPAGYTIRTGTTGISITFKKPVYQINDIGVGSTEEELTTAFPPKARRTRTMKGKNRIEWGVLYDLTDAPNSKWYFLNEATSFCIEDGKVSSIGIYIRH